jgi:High-affinity K+ transport system, ATPase chain B
VLLLDKTGTITLGESSGFAVRAGTGFDRRNAGGRRATVVAADETPEAAALSCWPNSVSTFRQRDMASLHAVPRFTAQTRMSGVDLPGREIRKGAADAVKNYVEATVAVSRTKSARSG